MSSSSGNAFEPSCMHSNLHPHTFGPKVRTRGSQPSILVRTFSLFTTQITQVVTLADAVPDAEPDRPVPVLPVRMMREEEHA
jgi:hypothetical protein